MLVNLRALLVRLIDIVLLRGGPESLPASASLLAILVVLSGAESALVASLIPAGPPVSVFELIVSSVLPLSWFWIAFAVAQKSERFVQTSIAFFGVNMIFQPVLAPMLVALAPYIEKQDPSMPPPAALSMLFLALTVWVVIIWVRIIRAAFEWPTFVAIIFVLAQNLVAVYVYAMLFGVSPDKV
jgi:hypothetical protein